MCLKENIKSSPTCSVQKSGFGNSMTILLWEILFKNLAGTAGVVRIHGTNKAVAASIDSSAVILLGSHPSNWWKTSSG